MSGAVLEHDLTIPRGAVLYARGWTLRGRDGHPIRTTDNLDVQAKVRRWAGDGEVLHTFNTSIVLMLLPGHYNDQPVAVAQIDEIPHTVTARFAWDRGVWDMQINHEDPIVGGLVSAPLVVSR